MMRRNPFRDWTTEVLESDLSTNAKMLLLVLSTYMNKWGDIAYPSRSTLAGQCSMSVKSVQRAIAECEERGWLKHTQRLKDGTKELTSNHYTLMMPDETRGVGSDSPYLGSHSPEGRVTESQRIRLLKKATEDTPSQSNGVHCITDDWKPRKPLAEIADQYGIAVSDVAEVVHDFKEYWKATGKRQKNWELVWVRNPVVKGKLHSLRKKNNGAAAPTWEGID